MWAQVVNAVLGIWLMAAPRLLGYGNPAADNAYIFGPVAATFAIVACWEATRGVRWGNLPVGLWLMAAPWVLGFDTGAAIWNSVTTGTLLVVFSFVRGKVEKHYGGGWTALWNSRKLHDGES